MRNKIFITISILLIGALLGACGSVASAQGLTPTPGTEGSGQTSPRTLTVSGSGQTYLTPDIAYINIGVHTEGTNAAEAVSSNNTQSQKVIDALKNMGINAKDIQTTNFSIYPQQQYDNQGKPVGEVKYMVDNTVYVTVRDLDKIGDLLDATVKAGANSINGIQFDVADRTQALSDARKAAVADAKGQAEELAQAAGVTLGVVQSISTSTGSQPVPFYQAKGAGAADVASVPVSPGQMLVTVDVNIVYEIH
jgi:uncharacterized protein YggE